MLLPELTVHRTRWSVGTASVVGSAMVAFIRPTSG
jgi:hypothetical protein